MKIISHIPILLVILSLFLFQCSKKIDNANNTSSDSTSILNNANKGSENEIISVDPDAIPEAIILIKKHLIENSSRYYTGGESVFDTTIYFVEGDYYESGIKDYFYTVYFEDGGDFGTPSYFFYYAEENHFEELFIVEDYENFYRIEIDSISNESLYGSTILNAAISMDITAGRVVKTEFRIIDNYIYIEPQFFPELTKSDAEVTREITQLSNDLDKANSDVSESNSSE